MAGEVQKSDEEIEKKQKPLSPLESPKVVKKEEAKKSFIDQPDIGGEIVLTFIVLFNLLLF